MSEIHVLKMPAYSAGTVDDLAVLRPSDVGRCLPLTNLSSITQLDTSASQPEYLIVTGDGRSLRASSSMAVMLETMWKGGCPDDIARQVSLRLGRPVNAPDVEYVVENFVDFPDTLEPAVEALRVAGIMMVVSVGNDGPGCTTATTPPASYDEVFSVGATDDNGDIFILSSRGPADGMIKPDVTAPGAPVRSTVPGGGYAYNMGTSMAAPHVAGLVALLWSVNPALIGDVDATEMLICQTAMPKPVENLCTAGDRVPERPFAATLSNPICACGDVTDVPNNVYGCGFIDAGAAVRAALGQ